MKKPDTKPISALLLGSYRDVETGTRVFRQLRRSGFRRSAALRYSDSGRILTIHSNRPPLFGVLAGGIFGLIALIGWLALFAGRTLQVASEPLLVALVLSTLAGAILGGLLNWWIDNIFKRRLIADSRRWLLAGEILVVVRTPSHRARAVVEVMRRVERGQPAIFVLRPPRPTPVPAGEPLDRERFTPERLRLHATNLAARLRIARQPGPTFPLWDFARSSKLTVEAVNEDLTEGAALGQSVSTAAEWLLDNSHIVQRHIGDVLDNLSAGFYEVLPVLEDGGLAGRPRIHEIAQEFVAHADSEVYERDIVEFLLGYQEVTPLTIAELWAMPLMIRLALVENLSYLAVQIRQRQQQHEQADFWSNRLLNAARRAPNILLPMLAELVRDQQEAPPYFGERLLSQLQGEAVALEPVRAWLERQWGAPVAEVLQEDQRRHAATQVTIASTIGSLRRLSQLDWRDTFEQVSMVERVLRADPAGVYSQMDFATRDSYRRAVEEIARSSSQSEIDVAQAAVDSARAVAGDPFKGHVGYFLADSGRIQLEHQAGHRPPLSRRLRRWAHQRPALLYVGTTGVITGLLLVGVLSIAPRAGGQGSQPVVLAVMAILAFLPLSELAVQVVNYLVNQLFPPWALPKLSFEDGVPDEWRALVVVPVILQTPAGVRGDLERLEVRFLGNQDPNLHFALLADFPDAPKPEMPEDAALLDEAVTGINGLNERYGGHFSLFYRSRAWSQSEQHWMGWERKRGKLEELNCFLVSQGGSAGAGDGHGTSLRHVGDPAQLRDFRLVITLDSDTQLPHGTAHRMIGTLAHPLNRPRLSAGGKRVSRGYTIIQPRVSTSLPSATASRFSRIFTNAVGTDPYTHVVSDVYQDLSGEASYHGKGIYNLETFHRVLDGRFPEETLLSHDLIEGAHVRVGLASDIELFDLFPSSYLAYSSRQHRWIRGDWQIAGWVLPSVPAPEGGRRPNPLDAMNRWKILDNLRRSLVPAASVALLLVGWLLFLGGSWLWTLLVGLTFFFPAILQLGTQLVTQPRSVIMGWQGWREIGPSWARALLDCVFLPHQAFLSLDAIGRVWYRRAVSRRRLLEWQTSQMAHDTARKRDLRVDWRVMLVSLLAVIVAVGFLWLDPAALLPAAPFLGLWVIFPAVVIWLKGGARRTPSEALSDSDRFALRRIARLTWRYFDEFVGRRTNWLPPDNYQDALRVEVAERTSPTNIGLWLLSTIAAHDMGYLTTDQVIQRGMSTMETLEKLERFQGHLLNWYDTRTLQPLYPRYVSTVDSGNLLASLWTLVESYREVLSGPILGSAAVDGLGDSLALALLDERSIADLPAAVDAGRASYLATTLAELFANPPETLDQLVARLRSAAGPAHELAQALREGLPEPAALSQNTEIGEEPDHRHGTSAERAVYWIGQVERQLARWTEIIERYFPWVERLTGIPEEYLSVLGSDFQMWRSQALSEAPSLRSLGEGTHGPLEELLAAAERMENPPEPVHAWLVEFRAAVSLGRWMAGEMLAHGEQVIDQATELAGETNMRFLYDPGRRLFSIGYNVSDRRLDSSYYDLLASEARIASLISIARGEVPLEHWVALGRPYGLPGGHRALLSWSGTMFEYLMPLIFTRSYENSLLDAACREAVNWQRQYATLHRIPWGVSEAAFAALDANRTYQYQAFGVPGLGLKRGLEDDLVVAPYASALALMIDPGPALQNLEHLAKLGLRSNYGFYDSIDFTRRRRSESETGVIVYTYMAHHQGMVLLSVDNLLHGNAMQARFHADPRVRAAEPLLFERIPVAPPLIEGPTRGEAPPRMLPATSVGFKRGFVTPDSPTPRTQLLANGNYAVMVTSAGGGYSHWRDLDLSRWSADTTLDCWGSFVYVKDIVQGSVWSATHQPFRRLAAHYVVSFSSNRAQFERRDAGIGTTTEIVVSLEDDVEIRRLTLVNYSNKSRELELTSYVELALAPHNSDHAHPAFSKLFVRTESLEDQSALLAWRKPRLPEDKPVWAVHALSLMESGDTEAGEDQYETDRARFVGRGRTLENPIALDGDLSNSVGSVLDPIFSLRRRVVVEPGQRVQVAFVTGVAETREGALALAQKYRDLRACRRAFELAGSQERLLARHLRTSEEDAQRFQQLASHMLFPNPRFRAPAKVLRENRLGQSRLWSYGISGDLPILLVTIGDIRDAELVRDALLAHTYWRLHGLKTDLVILDEEAAGYEQPLRDTLRMVIQANSQYAGTDQPGGVFLRAAGQMPAEELTLLQSVARVVLVASRGPLVKQLASGAEVVRLPAPRSGGRRAEEEPSAPLPFMELPYFNGLGGFTPDGREYATYLGPEASTPAPWINVMANPSFGALISEAGQGFAWYGNSQSNRLLPWSNDPVIDPSGDAIYIRDEQLGVCWTPTPSPIREMDAYRARHGQGYTVFEHNSHAIEQELVTFVPVAESGGLPVRVQRLTLRNSSSRRRTLRVTFYAEWVLGGAREDTQMHVVTTWDSESRALLARNSYHPDFGERVAFASSIPKAVSYTADRTEFLGRNGSHSNPAALMRQTLAGRHGAGLDPCAALQVLVEIDPGQEAEVTFLLGQAADPAEVRRLVQHFRDPGRVGQVLQETTAWWDRLLGTVQVDTPDLAVNFLLNRWLLYQSLSCRMWGRSAFYQSGGAIGFRDQLQDCLAMVYAAPRISREQILTAAAHQFIEGDVQHWWHPETGAGVRTGISDDLLWLPYVTLHYVRVTGDEQILDEIVPFLEGQSLADDELEAYFVPTVSLEAGSILDHCRRAIRKGLTSGPHGLPLIGTGDWNDGLNRVGEKGRGESVWLAWFLIDVLNSFAEVVERRGEVREAQGYRASAKRLASAVEGEAWDGEWYRRAYFDDGTPLGSQEDPEMKIDSLPQSWGAISGAANPQRVEQALQSAERYLVRDDDQLVLLFTPPFGSLPPDAAQEMPNPGYIAGYPPGVRENGGQYTHGALWLALAFARRGDGDRAGRLLKMLNPVEHARTPEEAGRYKVEPYVVPADIYALEGSVGQGGWTWYTGSAGWMYRIWVEEVLGFKLRGKSLIPDPVIPSWWDGFTLRYRFGITEYEIVVENPDHVSRGVAELWLDGGPVPVPAIILQDDGRDHRIVVRLGHPTEDTSDSAGTEAKSVPVR
jgi:cyclic beta-1,2-glucan synthetase